ncbi:heterokaryon incompatibility protein-domain-containing protein [Paraphoma chrysanthemicola]|uniref:Heterokaryon incompatibility protein-domain-containing protein n=1 Tax=Paraphoma chrysanthemicola TaxID=798071 RepID=A0A8K0RAD8_9PLEO|nr:heterokaryon incompatibility protein-domain-containing protein [Paraphoma chrysanthemicola]
MAGNTAQADDDLCKECASLKLSVHDFLSSVDNVSRNTSERTSFHKIALPATNILSGRRCRFCRFLIAAFVDCNPQALGKESPLWDGVDCTLEWVQDGRSIGQIGKNTALTRRLRLSTTNKSISDAYLVLMAPEGQSHRFLGRSINPLRIDVNMIRRWLRDCEMYHGTKCAPLSATSTERLLKNPRFRVIDVWSECVVTGIDGPFIALSYVWGDVQPHRLTKSNAHQFFRPGALTEMSLQILRTIRDALEVTKQLGYRYIWIDSYCIIQDDVDDTTTMIQLMDMIYTAASLTICAAEGAAAHSGISGILAANRNSPQITVQYEKDVCLMASESAESYIARSVWNSRAWTFQERLCSTRSLVFAEGRAFFQCRTSSMREDIHMESTTSNDYDSGWSLELKDVPGRLFSENPVRQYTKCTELFTERKMAYDNDKLKAFSAIQSILSNNMNSDFHFALPTAYFDFALLWIPLTPTRRLPGFPSWSWCGWGAKVEYKYQTLEGGFANLHEWCNTRTWITWYRKASQSDRFEYIWDGRRGGLPGRWSGYTVQ